MTQPIDPFSLINPDVVCVADLDPFGTECTSDLQVLQQDVYHLLLEDYGSNPDDPDRGIGVENYLSGTLDALKKLPKIIDTQLLKDDRITAANTSISQQSDDSWLLVVEIECSQGIFPLSFSLSQAGGLQIVN